MNGACDPDAPGHKRRRSSLGGACEEVNSVDYTMPNAEANILRTALGCTAREMCKRYRLLSGQYGAGESGAAAFTQNWGIRGGFQHQIEDVTINELTVRFGQK